MEEVAKAVGGGYFRLQMPLRLALGVRGTAAGRRLGALERGGRPITQVAKIAEGQEDRTRSREHATGRSQGDPRMTGVCVVQVPRDALEPNAASEAAPEAVRQAVGGGCQSGWGRVFSVTNAIEAGTWRQGDSGWA